LVEIACFSDNGIFVPVGIVTTLGSAAGAGLGVAAGVELAGVELAAGAELTAGAELGVALSGFGASAACPNAIPEIRTTIHNPRICTSTGKTLPSRTA
jgi:hypothetical protein